jgi:hypothetical protein
MRRAFHLEAHEPHLEHARDAGLASDSRQMTLHELGCHGRDDPYSSGEFWVVVAVIALIVAIWLFT